jgi:hypothetical protein
LAEMAPSVGEEWFLRIGNSAAQVTLLRDIAGNPFRPLTLCGLERRPFDNQWAHVDANGGFWLEAECPACRPLLTPTVIAIARRAYDERDFAALGVLADALEEAGCQEEAVLHHLRGWAPCPVCLCADPPPEPGEWCTYCGTERWESWEFRNGPHARGCWALDLLLGLN